MENNNYTSVVDTIANMFGNVITREVIFAIVESYEGNLDLSVDAIMNITGDDKDEGHNEGGPENKNQSHDPNIPSVSTSSQTVANSQSPKLDAVQPSTSYASVSQSKGAIPKQIVKPKVAPNSYDFWTEQMRQIMTYHNQGARTLIIMRGVPGSGKTYLAKQIIEMTIGSSFTDFRKHIFSTDDFFMNRGQYQYDKYKLSEAHAWNQARVRQELFNGLSPIIVDNTNIELWEMEPYARDGVRNGYYIEVVEPNTPWARKSNQLCKRNIHNVPITTIKRMLENYQGNITGYNLRQIYDLSYPLHRMPPVLRQNPPLQFGSVHCDIEEKMKKMMNLKSESPTESQEECSAVLQIHESGSTEGLTEAVPESNCSNKTDTSEQNNIKEEAKIQKGRIFLDALQRNTHDDIAEQLPQKEIVPHQSIGVPDKNLDEIEQVEAEWENGEQWDDDSKKFDVACSNIISTLNNEPKPPRKQGATEPVLSGNIMDTVNKCEDWSQISMFMPAWHDTVKPTAFGIDVVDKDAVVEKKSISTCIEIGDTDVINNKNYHKVISATPKDINIFYVSSSNEKIPDKRKLDKSTSTYEHTISEAYRCKNEEKHFAAFRRMFKNVGRADLRDIFDKCQGDVNWAVDIVLDSMSNKLLETVENDLSDVEEDIIEECECLAAYNIIPGSSSSKTQTTVTEDVPENISDNKPQSQRKSKRDIILSDSSMELKRQIEMNVNISENHYSPHCLKLKKMRHGENVKPINSPEQTNEESQDVPGSSADTTASVNDSDDDEESNAGCIEEPAKVANVSVGMEFISMLDDMFGRKNMDYPSNVTPTMSISISVLNELNASWMESLMFQLENESKQMQEIIKQDEEFARALELKEKELMNAGKEPPVPDFKEIMDWDFALSLYHKDLADWRNNEPQDLAGRLSRDKLYNLFPEVSQDVLSELLVAHHNNFQATVESLLVSTGKQDVLNQENGVNKFVIEKELQRQKKILAREKEALTGEESPLLPRGETATMETVNQYRNKAEMHLLRRNMKHQKAQDFIRRGMTQVANHYSDVAAYHKQCYEHANSLAAAALVQVHARNNPNSDTIDLHYMRVGEARESLDIFIDFHIRKLQDNRGHRAVSLFFITGRGLHSQGQPRIKPAVKKRLRERGLSFSERNPGLLTAKVCADDKLSYQVSTA